MAIPEVVPGWEYARLRFDLVRMARQIAGPAAAEDLVQRVFIHVARCGPAAPRDVRGLPRPAYLTSLLYAFAAPGDPAMEEPDPAAPVTLPPRDVAPVEAVGARGG